MPGTRAATQRAEAQRVALLAAASNAETQSINPELVDSVIKHLPRSQLASARLVSKQFTAAVDPLIKAVSIDLKKSWDMRVTPVVGLQHVTRMDVGIDVKGSAQLRQLHHIASQLPKLNTLRSLSALDTFPVSFASALSSLTRLEIQSFRGWRADEPQHDFSQHGAQLPGAQLPGLKAASFGFMCDLADIAVLAPNLEQLYCHNLNILDSPAAALPACTHFGSKGLRITSNTAAAAAQAFAAAFPNLQVVTYMPTMTDETSPELLAQQLLAHLPAICAVRGWSRLVMQSAAAVGPQVLLQLQRLCLHGMEGLYIPSISSMRQLQHVCITFPADEADGTWRTWPQALLHELAALPQLQSLVLPAGLLCSQCCPGVQSSLQGLTAKSSLKQLVFLEWRDSYSGGLQTGVSCTHPETRQAGSQSVAAAAGAAASTQKHRSQQQQQQLTVLHQRQHMEDIPWEANPDSAAGVWGVYGPPGEW